MEDLDRGVVMERFMGSSTICEIGRSEISGEGVARMSIVRGVCRPTSLSIEGSGQSLYPLDQTSTGVPRWGGRKRGACNGISSSIWWVRSLSTSTATNYGALNRTSRLVEKCAVQLFVSSKPVISEYFKLINSLSW